MGRRLFGRDFRRRFFRLGLWRNFRFGRCFRLGEASRFIALAPVFDLRRVGVIKRGKFRRFDRLGCLDRRFARKHG